MSTGAIDTIDYVATDTYGDTATSKRTVLIVAASSTPPEPPAPDATTTQVTSTFAIAIRPKNVGVSILLQRG